MHLSRHSGCWLVAGTERHSAELVRTGCGLTDSLELINISTRLPGRRSIAPDQPYTALALPRLLLHISIVFSLSIPPVSPAATSSTVPSMSRHAYAYAQAAVPTQRYSSTSSAFSPSANPNEDWTKISDLAERRRIQNRIAQRNYRKKLKKRLEDLERRAASSSASPEQRPAELDRSHAQPRDSSAPVNPADQGDYSRRSPDMQQHFLQPHDDRTMFSYQNTRQISTSPPPFTAYSTYPAPDAVSYAYSQTPYHAMPATTAEMQMPYTPYLPPISSTVYPGTLPSIVPAKQEFYGEDEISPFSMNYASLTGIDIPVTHPTYQDSNAQTPPLSDSFESCSGSPPESVLYNPATPASMPGTPPQLHCY